MWEGLPLSRHPIFSSKSVLLFLPESLTEAQRAPDACAGQPGPGEMSPSPHPSAISTWHPQPGRGLLLTPWHGYQPCRALLSCQNWSPGAAGRAGQGCSPGESVPQGSVESVLVPPTPPKSKPSGLPLESINKSPSGIPLLPPGKSHLEVGLCQQRLADEHSSCCHRRHEGRLLQAPPHPRYAPRTTGALHTAHGPHRCKHKGQAEFMPPFSLPRLTFGMDFKVNTSSTG